MYNESNQLSIILVWFIWMYHMCNSNATGVQWIMRHQNLLRWKKWKMKKKLIKNIAKHLRYFLGTNYSIHSLWPRIYTRVVHGDIKFGILRDPLNFPFLIDLYGPYLIKSLIENGSFLLTKAHLFGANWTSRPPTSEAFLAHFSLWKGTWNVFKTDRLALTFPKMVWKSQIGPKVTELQRFENHPLSQIKSCGRAVVA